MSDGGPALVWCPFPDAASAGRAADVLLAEHLVACANILPAMQSRYVWRGAHHVETETGVLFKTDRALLEKLIARIPALHPADEPAILGWACDAAAPATARWLGNLVALAGLAGGDVTGERS